MGHEPDLQNTVYGCRNTQLDLRASSVYFQVAHQPHIEAFAVAAASQEPIPAGFALVTQTHTHSHPRIWKNLFSWRESHLLCKPCNIISPWKLFVFQYLKRRKGKHRQFICLLYQLWAPSNHTTASFHITVNDDSQKVPFQLFAMCLIALSWACLHKSHLQNVLLLPTGAKSEPICTSPK